MKYAVRCVSSHCCGHLTAADHRGGDMVAFADSNGIRTYKPVAFDTLDEAQTVQKKATFSDVTFAVIEYREEDWMFDD